MEKVKLITYSDGCIYKLSGSRRVVFNKSEDGDMELYFVRPLFKDEVLPENPMCYYYGKRKFRVTKIILTPIVAQCLSHFFSEVIKFEDQ